MDTGFINHKKIFDFLEKSNEPDSVEVAEILSHAKELKGLSHAEAARLIMVNDATNIQHIFDAASYVKEAIYGKRLVLFAPLYVSNICKNECLYCAFRLSNRDIVRRTLSQEDIKKETEALIDQGHKRVLLVSGEGQGEDALEYTVKAIESIYEVKKGNGEIRRINVNIAPLSVEGFKRLHDAKIGTYQLFQETYHYDSYKKMHIKGVKSNYLNHLTAMDRAMAGGIDDVGIGVLFGLYDYRFEILALLQHIEHLEKTFGVGPHTISVPRIEPASGSDISLHPPYELSDTHFKKIIAILRLTVPYTGMILSTRENATMRQDALSLGISQISAGSRTNPGGYTQGESEAQFSLGDHRSLDEVISDIANLGYIPSFCTGCYRMGRTGQDFMDLAKPGLIKNYCLPNALSTFSEYLEHYGSAHTKKVGSTLIQNMLQEIPNKKVQATTELYLERIRKGEKDLYF